MKHHQILLTLRPLRLPHGLNPRILRRRQRLGPLNQPVFVRFVRRLVQLERLLLWDVLDNDVHDLGVAATGGEGLVDELVPRRRYEPTQLI